MREYLLCVCDVRIYRGECLNAGPGWLKLSFWGLERLEVHVHEHACTSI